MVDFDHWVRRRHWTRKKIKEETRKQNKIEEKNRDWHSMKAFVETMREKFKEKK